MARQLHISPLAVTMVLLPIGLAALVYYIVWGSMYNFIMLSFTPIFLSLLLLAFKKPILSIFVLFTLNYFFTPWTRYSEIDGLSVWSDIVWWSTFVIVIIRALTIGNIPWKRAINPLTIGGIFWAAYTVAEIINPSAITEAWVYSRSFIYNIFLVSLLTSLLVTSYKHLRIVIFLFSIYTILAILKAFWQKYIGFDAIEWAWLQEGSEKTHLLAHTTRYFSFFTDAGNFGSNMGFASVVFSIISFYTKNKKYRIYYLIVAIFALYAMFMSGTRGAMFVPLGGLLLFTLMNKNIKLMCISGLLGICIYVFFAYTYIGENNQMISRMRTSFNPTKDASYLVRKNNQRILATYLKNKPFGEGLGLGGVEAQKYAYRVTTLTPHDSTYVKIWMETGIVGLVSYLIIYITSLLWGCYLIMFKVKNIELRGTLTALACGILGMMISAYGNAFFNQFPTGVMMILFLSILLNSKYIDDQLTRSKTNTIPQ